MNASQISKYQIVGFSTDSQKLKGNIRISAASIIIAEMTVSGWADF
jgi:hypothetical protein